MGQPTPSGAGPLPPLAAHLDEATVFRSMFAAYPDAMLLVDRSGVIVQANPAAASLFGYAIEELTRLDVDALVPDAIRPRHASFRQAYGNAPRPRPMGTQMDLVARRKDGSEVMVEIALSPLQDRDLPYVVAAIRDIGAYPRVRQALQRQRYAEHLAQFGRFVVDARDPQLLLDHAATIAAAALQIDVAMVFLLEPDRQAVKVAAGFGAIPGEEVGALIPYDPGSSPGLVISQGQPLIDADYRSEQRFVVKPAYLDAGLASALAVPLSDGRRTIGALTARSRTPSRFGGDDLRFLESLASLLATGLQRAQSDEALNHAQRLESVGQLTGGIAHDFNNLLAIIEGNLEVLDGLPASADEDYRRQLVAAAARAARRGAELTGKLLAFSRRQVLEPAPVDMGALLGSLANMLRRTLDQRIEIFIEVAPDCPPVLADPGQLESALLNIAINARDAMPEGGTLAFRSERCRSLSMEVRKGFDDPSIAADQIVAISVADTGRGMSEEVRERAFEPFFTTKSVGRGTGLGLSSVYGFVKQSRGTIVLDSVPGSGTTLTLYLPSPWPDAEPTIDGTSTEQAIPAGLGVLLVEDDPDVRSVVRTFLEGMGCTVTMAASGEQALRLLEAAEVFDVLLTDIALGPGLRGTELAAQAQPRHPRMAVILMSGFSAELIDADRDSPLEWELLRKPFNRSELAAAMARAVGARQ